MQDRVTAAPGFPRLSLAPSDRQPQRGSGVKPLLQWSLREIANTRSDLDRGGETRAFIAGVVQKGSRDRGRRPDPVHTDSPKNWRAHWGIARDGYPHPG